MSLTRRTFLKQLGTLAFAAGTVGVADLLLVEPDWLEVTAHRVRVPGLAPHLEGYRVVQVSDVHMAGFGQLHVEMLAAIDRFAPNLIALTGEIIGRASGLQDFDTVCDTLMRPGHR